MASVGIMRIVVSNPEACTAFSEAVVLTRQLKRIMPWCRTLSEIETQLVIAADGMRAEPDDRSYT